MHRYDAIYNLIICKRCVFAPGSIYMCKLNPTKPGLYQCEWQKCQGPNLSCRMFPGTYAWNLLYEHLNSSSRTDDQPEYEIALI